MLPRAAITGVLILSASCNKTESADVIGSAPSSGPGGSARGGSGSGFSADLARELGAGAAPAAGSGGTKAGDPSKAGDPPKAGTEVPKAGGDAVAPAGTAARPDPAAKPGEDAVAPAGTAARPDPAAKPGATAVAPAGAAARPDPASPAKAVPSAGAASPAPEVHGQVKVSADLAAIKLSLLPNWDRDIDEAGTFQYVVRIKGTQSTKTFSFRYGYDEPKAPGDHDQYKKYLQESKLLLGEIKDRQRGAAWFLEGTDASGLPAFRYLVVYGGKHLICYGSLYKDAESNRLGDDRDQTVIQAKQICESMAL